MLFIEDALKIKSEGSVIAPDQIGKTQLIDVPTIGLSMRITLPKRHVHGHR